MKLTCLIIDDEETARRGLAALLSDFPELELLGTCANGVAAIDQIKKLRPDLIFLDVQMPGINGFEVLVSIPRPWPEVILVTAYDQFALKAFDINAVDYLLKPFSDERFAKAVAKACKQVGVKEQTALNDLIAPTRASLQEGSLVEANARGRLVIKADGSIHLLNIAEIIYIEAFDYYVKIHIESRFFLLRETMKNLEDRLAGKQFSRIHKSFIVNTAYVKALHKLEHNEYEVELTINERLKVSRTFKSSLMQALGI